MIRVKVCGLTDPLNASEVADAGADFMGFIFYRKSKRYVGDNPGPELFRYLPEHPGKVGVFVNEKAARVIETVKRFGINMVQLHGDETARYCQTIREAGYKVIKVFGMGPDFDFSRLLKYMPACDYFMFDTKTVFHGGSGIRFRWDVLLKYDLDKPFFLSGGIGPEDIQNIRSFDHKAFYAADINSRFEIATGKKNTALVRDFIQDIKTKLI